jgi:hypothetical protein
MPSLLFYNFGALKSPSQIYNYAVETKFSLKRIFAGVPPLERQNEEDNLRFGSSGHDCYCGPRRRARQAYDEGRNARRDASPYAPQDDASSPHDEKADDGQKDVRWMAPQLGPFFFRNLLLPVCFIS